MTEPSQKTQQQSTEKEGKTQENESKLKSMAKETKGLVNDLKDWVDLRVKLLQIEVEERIEAAASKIISLLGVAVLAIFAVLMFLIAAAEAIGLWLGHPSYGYGMVGIVVAVLAVLLNRSRPRFGSVNTPTENETQKDKNRLLEEKVAVKELETPNKIDHA